MILILLALAILFFMGFSLLLYVRTQKRRHAQAKKKYRLLSVLSLVLMIIPVVLFLALVGIVLANYREWVEEAAKW